MKTYLKYLAVAGGLAIAALLLPDIGPLDAWAQTAPAVGETTTVTTTAPPLTDTQVNITTVRDGLIVLGGTILTGILSAVGMAVRAFFASKYDLNKTTLDEKFQGIYDLAAKRAIAYAESVAKEKVPEKFETNSAFVKMAAEYLMSHWPDVVAHTGMTSDQVRDTIISRLPTPTAKEADQLALVKAGAAAPASVAVAVVPKA